MKMHAIKVARIGNSRGIRIPATLLRKYHIADSVFLEERDGEMVIRPRKQTKLSWEETFKQMKQENEDWSHWEKTTGDGLDGL